MRVLIDIPDDHLASLDALAQRKGRSRAAEVREAVKRHLESRSDNDWIGRGFGYWSTDDAQDKPAGKRALPRIAGRV